MESLPVSQSSPPANTVLRIAERDERCSVESEPDDLDPVWRQELWRMDAVCINQEDVSERNSQVRMMAEIFGNARRALVWLGQDSPQMAHSSMTLREATEDSPVAERSEESVRHLPRASNRAHE